MNNRHSTKQKIPFEIMKQAVSGKIEAVAYVLNYYASYINKLAQRMYTDNTGKTVIYIDENLKERIEAKLVSKLHTFKI